jgi:hypothetical protein
MKLIGKNVELIQFLEGDFSLISSKISRLDIYKENEDVSIEVEIELLYSKKEKKLKLKFIDIIEYSFYYNSQYIFYNIEDYKFFIENDIVYVSFDPFDQEVHISLEDQDFIKSKSVEGYI